MYRSFSDITYAQSSPSYSRPLPNTPAMLRTFLIHSKTDLSPVPQFPPIAEIQLDAGLVTTRTFGRMLAGGECRRRSHISPLERSRPKGRVFFWTWWNYSSCFR